MYRLALGIEYDGFNYHGWQSQKELITVQGAVEDALSKVANHQVTVVCAGRTDVGVHALEQVIHFDTTAERSIRSWILGGNTNLPLDIKIQWATRVVSDFHARYSAQARHYRYLIYNHNVPSAILHHKVTLCLQSLDAELMHTGAQYLLGEHDFSAFRGIDCQSYSAKRNVTAISVQRDGQMIIIDIVANAFLLHMVRNIVGVLLEIGFKKRHPNWAQQVLHGKNRHIGYPTAPAQGLYLIKVYYPQHFALAQSTDYHPYRDGDLVKLVHNKLYN